MKERDIYIDTDRTEASQATKNNFQDGYVSK